MSKQSPKCKSVYLRSRRHTNMELNSHLDEAKKYSSMVSEHLFKSSYENHVLQTAAHSYQFSHNKSMRKNRKKKMVVNPNPEESPLKQLGKMPQQSPARSGLSQSKEFVKPYLTHRQFYQRTGRVPQMNELLIERQSQKKSLQQKIASLAKLINHEQKKKTKVSLQCSKFQNHIQLTTNDTLKKEQQSRKYNIEINQLHENCMDLAQQLKQLKERINFNQSMIAEQTQLTKQTKSFVQSARIELRREQQIVSEVKQKQSTGYKSMTNQYMLMNQLKEQKAKLLNVIHNDVQLHPVCKPYGRVE